MPAERTNPDDFFVPDDDPQWLMLASGALQDDDAMMAADTRVLGRRVTSHRPGGTLPEGTPPTSLPPSPPSSPVPTAEEEDEEIPPPLEPDEGYDLFDPPEVTSLTTGTESQVERGGLVLEFTTVVPAESRTEERSTSEPLATPRLLGEVRETVAEGPETTIRLATQDTRPEMRQGTDVEQNLVPELPSIAVRPSPPYRAYEGQMPEVSSEGMPSQGDFRGVPPERLYETRDLAEHNLALQTQMAQVSREATEARTAWSEMRDKLDNYRREEDSRREELVRQEVERATEAIRRESARQQELTRQEAEMATRQEVERVAQFEEDRYLRLLAQTREAQERVAEERREEADRQEGRQRLETPEWLSSEEMPRNRDDYPTANRVDVIDEQEDRTGSERMQMLLRRDPINEAHPTSTREPERRSDRDDHRDSTRRALPEIATGRPQPRRPESPVAPSASDERHLPHTVHRGEDRPSPEELPQRSTEV